jgi:hypothetical protein
MKTITYVYRGEVERWDPKRRSYVWWSGYSTTGPKGEVRFPWMTKIECSKDAKRDGAKAVFEENIPS